MSFSSDLQRFAKKSGISLDQAVAETFLKISNSIIRDTPVDTGRLKGNWFATIDHPSSDTSDTRTESDALRNAEDTAGKASGTIAYLTNNLPYAYRIEFEGWSKKAPEGMVRRNVAIVKMKLALSK